MAENNVKYEAIAKEKFEFVNDSDRIHDKPPEDKPIGYLRDAWNRFKKSRVSVVAAIIIMLIIIYAFLTPVLITSHDSKLMVSVYSKKSARVTALYDYGLNGSTTRDFSEKGLILALATGVGAEDWAGEGGISIADAMDSYYMPIISVTGEKTTLNAAKKEVTTYTAKIDNYLEVGFKYYLIEQSEYQAIREFEEETGLHVLYPLIENNEYCLDSSDANYWYKSSNGTPVSTESGTVRTVSYSEDLVLEDNYKRDANGDLVYYEYAGGGTAETAQYRVRVLYYNYYVYLYGSEPNYILGTDSQGYDMALRLAGGIKLSLLLAVCVSAVNFVIGACYGAVAGYYGGTVDLVMERISDILHNMPFMVVATLFQLHFAAKLGALPCLFFAYILTGWISIQNRVRTQFYRFKNQEYVMAARTLGARDRRIIWKHIFPNTLGTIITSCALTIPNVINSESMLSYLGIVNLGSSSGTSLGTLLSEASGIWTNYPHLMICPAVVLSLLMISFNLFGNGLRDAFNPSLRGVEE